jgi:ABC-2 type transport system permease protein
MRNLIALKHAKYELHNILRHPEQLLLIIGTPIGLLIAFRTHLQIVNFAIVSSALSSSFTSVAINTAFARRYGTLKYLSVTPVGIRGLVLGQSAVGVLLLGLQIPVVLIGAKLLTIESAISFHLFLILPLVVSLFTLMAYLFSSVLTAEKVLAFANITFLALIASGMVFQESSLAYLHPLAGVAHLNETYLQYFSVLILSNFVLLLALRRYFKWID